MLRICKPGALAVRRSQAMVNLVEQCVGRSDALSGGCTPSAVAFRDACCGLRFIHSKNLGQTHFPGPRPQAQARVHQLVATASPAAAQLPKYSNLANLAFDPVLEFTTRLRGAADLPERLVVEKVRPVWKLVLGEHAFPNGLRALSEALAREGSAGAAVLAQLRDAVTRYPVSTDSLVAAATLRVFDATPRPIRSAFKLLRYSDIDEAKAEVEWLAKKFKLPAERTTRLLDAVDDWYPVYEWADEEVMTNGWE